MADKLNILIVEDEVDVRRTYERQVAHTGHDVRVAGSVEEGRERLREMAADVAFVDYTLPDGVGSELVAWAVAEGRIAHPYCVTGFGSCRVALAAARAGCVDVLEKPVAAGQLIAIVERHAGAGGEFDTEDFDAWRAEHAPDVLGADGELIRALETVRAVADVSATVFITGESGTGKELFARAVHAASSRSTGPFVAINCAAIPESLIEAELFGHARGAFTGAVVARKGRIATAHGGTLFLDEIGDMPIAAQAKLLRVLEERCVSPIGSDQLIPIDVRVVAATNQNLDKQVDEGEFRADLYYRLSVIPVELPPLRERKGDISLLAHEFLTRANARNRRSVTGFDAGGMRMLERHDWPGNVRELLHRVERAVLLNSSGVLTADDLSIRPLGRAAGGPANMNLADGLDLRSAMDTVERQLIAEALERTGGNRTEAAGLLGLNRTTLVEKIRKHKRAA